MKKLNIAQLAEKYNLDAYVETRNIATCDIFGDCFGLTGFGISYADSPRYHHNAALRRDRPDITFQLTLSGCGIFERGRQRTELTPGTGFLCDIRNDQGYSYYFPEGAKEPWRFIYFQFFGGVASEIVRRLVASNGNVFQFPLDHPLFETLPDVPHEKEGVVTRVLPSSFTAAVVTEILETLAESAESKIRSPENERIVEKACNQATVLGGRNVNVSELAAASGLSREHFTRIFSKTLGITPNEYIHSWLVSSIINKLCFSDDSIGAIADTLGFDSVNTMVRMFRNRKSMYPGEMRSGLGKK